MEISTHSRREEEAEENKENGTQQQYIFQPIDYTSSVLYVYEVMIHSISRKQEASVQDDRSRITGGKTRGKTGRITKITETQV